MNNFYENQEFFIPYDKVRYFDYSESSIYIDVPKKNVHISNKAMVKKIVREITERLDEKEYYLSDKVFINFNYVMLAKIAHMVSKSTVYVEVTLESSDRSRTMIMTAYECDLFFDKLREFYQS